MSTTESYSPSPAKLQSARRREPRTDEAARRRDNTLALGDGRILGFAEYGDPAGEPILYFHGHPGSRLEAALLAEPATQAGARLIGTDRPGMGLSEFQPRRRIIDWPADVEQLADTLGLERFAVAGGSGGGPYAAACAFSIPERLTACGLISSAGPPKLSRHRGEIWINRLQSRLAILAPWALDLAFAVWGRRVRLKGRNLDGAVLGSVALRSFPEVDRLALAEPPLLERLGESLFEAFASGSRGVARDARLLYRGWGFDLGAIRGVNTHVWHGELDRNVAVETGRAIAGAILGARSHMYPEDGHLSVAVNHAEDIFEALLAPA